jgi:hypothetical protein
MNAGVGYYFAGNVSGPMSHMTDSRGNGCATCHMAEGSLTSGGHTFEMGSNTSACETCHGSNADDFGFLGVQDDVQDMLDDLGHKLEVAGIAHYDAATDHWGPVPGTYPANTVAAWWNFIGVVNDGSRGIHNPPYIKAILQGAINAMTPAAAYAGSSTCESCHQTYYDQTFDSGHPYKVNKVVGSVAPTYPFSTVPNPPAGYTWADISYVIGGYGWKARFLDTDGYFITAGGSNQWNIGPETWSDYHKDEVEKPYNCGVCHTTGWQTFEENGGVRQDGLPGMAGTWSEPGVTCEACHGPGGDHIVSMDAADITVDNSTALCNECHVRNWDSSVIPASGGFIKHREQGNELANGAHSSGSFSLSCGSCHDPHIGTQYGHADAGGITQTCETCHASQAASNSHINGPTCVDCHMARTGKSAVAVNAYQGDIRSHLFTINPDGTKTKTDMFNEAGSLADKGWFTLDFACYSCHTDENGVGGAFSMKTMAELSAKATGIHN